jgi:hypothetical protein
LWMEPKKGRDSSSYGERHAGRREKKGNELSKRKREKRCSRSAETWIKAVGDAVGSEEKSGSGGHTRTSSPKYK